MNTTPKDTQPESSTQFNNHDDVFAYRSQAARLRSEAVKSALKGLLARTKAQFAQKAQDSDSEVQPTHCQAA
ncbi:MAG: hypothetical protein ACRBC3_18095 [Burkholderiaceae bacterium]